MTLRERIIFIGIGIINLIASLLNRSTFDSGDSIHHYLQAHQAFATPHLFLDHWAKPVFIALASPFAYWGWFGIELFNVFCVLGSCLTVFFLFKHYQLKPWWAVFLCLFSHHFFLIQSSGLTEPLFALLLIQIVYQSAKKRLIWATILLSFLPMVRSEGWIIMLIFLVYIIAEKRLRTIPFLITGTVFYSVLGAVFKGNTWWLFNENPYSGNEAIYGKGDFLHFVEQLPYLIGLPIFILFLLGLFWAGRMLLKNQMKNHAFFLIYGITIGYIVAHSIWWQMGWFHSMGLNRVLLVLVPLLAFIAYRGLEQLTCSIYFLKAKYIEWFMIAVIALFPFIDNPMSIQFPDDTILDGSQTLAIEAVKKEPTNNDQSRDWYISNLHLAVVSDRKLNVSGECFYLEELNRHKPKPGSLLFWDSYFAERNAGFSLKEIEQMNVKERLKVVGTYSNKPYVIHVFEVLE